MKEKWTRLLCVWFQETGHPLQWTFKKHFFLIRTMAQIFLFFDGVGTVFFFPLRKYLRTIAWENTVVQWPEHHYQVCSYMKVVNLINISRNDFSHSMDVTHSERNTFANTHFDLLHGYHKSRGMSLILRRVNNSVMNSINGGWRVVEGRDLLHDKRKVIKKHLNILLC